MRIALLVLHRLCLAIAAVSLAYLLFIFGHVEIEVTSHERVFVVAIVTAVSAMAAGILSWAGLPGGASAAPQRQGRRRRAAK